MPKVYIKIYADYTVSGSDFATVSSQTMRRIVFSPDNKHMTSISQLRDGCLIMVNQGGVPVNFTISRNRKVIASVKQNGIDPILLINTNWKLTEEGISNREIHTNPDLPMSSALNIDIGSEDSTIRIDLKIENSGFAACVLSKKELLCVRMNGNHFVPRLQGVIANEAQHLLEMPDVKERVGRIFFREWVGKHEWGLK